MKKIFILKCVESERGWGQDHFQLAFDTLEEAQAKRNKINGKLTATITPDVYVRANDIYEAVEDENGKIFLGEMV